MPIVGIIIAAIIVLGGGASLAAQSSLPGDVLYPMKVSINEEVRASLKTSEAARATYEEQRAETRLEEAEEVAVKSQVHADLGTQIENRFQAQVERTRTRIAALAAVDAQAAAEISSNFETALQAHDQILVRFADKDADAEEQSQMRHLASLVAGEGKTEAEHRMRFEDQASASIGVDNKSAVEGKQKATAQKIQEVKTFIDAAKAGVGASTLLQAQAQIDAAQKVFVDATAKLQAGAYGPAFVLFQKAERMAQAAKMMVQGSQRLQVQVNTREEGSESASSSDEVEVNTKLNIRTASSSEDGAVKMRIGY